MPSSESATYDLVVVANRLPVDRVVGDDGTVGWKQSPGGLVTAMESVMHGREGAWVGWSGDPGEPPEPFDEAGMHLHAVGLSEQDVKDHYEGFSNDTLWPLYHDVIVAPRYRRSWFDGYRRVNRRFAEAAALLVTQGGTVWVHDYQLQLVPAMLRELRPDVRIGWFDHIPFPSVELFAQLPWRRGVVEGLLGADLLGFQRRADAENFLRVCRRLLALPTRADTVTVRGPDGEDRVVRAAAFPISIDASGLEKLARTPAVVERAAQIRRDLGDPQILLLGVDRLDYTKGIRHRLKAYEELLADDVVRPPEAVLVQVATPSRERVAAYVRLREDVEVTVGRANGDYGQLGQPAIHYLHQSYGRDEMAALFLAADVMLVTPLRDGMNLVAKEYVTCRYDEGGALVLSEFTGASGELDRAFLCNPHDIDGLKTTIRVAIESDPGEKRRRMRSMRRRVREHDVRRWADDFLTALDLAPRRPAAAALTGSPQHTASGSPERAASGSPQDSAGAAPQDAAGGSPSALAPPLVAALRELASRRPVLVALDFDGVLAPIVEHASDARLLPGVGELVAEIAAADGALVALVSGRARADLAALTGLGGGEGEGRSGSGDRGGPVLLVGSHGAEVDGTPPRGLDAAALERLELVTGRLRTITAEHPGAAVEVKPSAAVLHTRQVAREQVEQATSAALQAVQGLDGVHVTHGKEVVEVAVTETSKGAAVRALREAHGVRAVLYVGDDVTDETVFRTLGPGDIGVKVGEGDTAAAHRVADPAAVRDLLQVLRDQLR